MLPSCRSLLSLLRHQLRLLAQNHCACLVLMMFVAIAAVGPRVEAPQRPVCYVLYWQEDAYVERLRTELPSDDLELAIEFASAEQFLTLDGRIAYPPGVHSIQLRPPNEHRDAWLIWFWYSGMRANVLNPVADRFWAITRRHFDPQPAMSVRTSAFGSRMGIFDAAGPAIQMWVAKGHWKIAVVWGALFFCGCYLTAMALSQQREDRTIFTLVTTPVGWLGVGLATAGFYFALTFVLGLSLAIVFGCGSFSGLWAPLMIGSAVYVAVGFTLGCWCRGTASTSAGMLVYVLLAGLIVLAAQQVPGIAGPQFSFEFQIVRMLQDSATTFVGLPASLAIWMMLWFLVARRSFARLQFQ